MTIFERIVKKKRPIVSRILQQGLKEKRVEEEYSPRELSRAKYHKEVGLIFFMLSNLSGPDSPTNPRCERPRRTGAKWRECKSFLGLSGHTKEETTFPRASIEGWIIWGG